MKQTILAILACVVFIAVPLHAQNKRASGEAGIHVGYRLFDADVDDEVAFGAHIGLNITDNVEVELRYDKIDTELEGTGHDVDLDAFSLGFVWNFHPDGDIDSPHVPYFTAGGGVQNFDFPDAEVAIEDDFDFLFVGGGYRYFWTEYFGIRWDVRAIFYGDDGDLGETDETDIQTSVGLTWVFGGGY